MSTTQVTTLEDRLKRISEKSGKTLEEVRTAYNAALESVPATMKVEKRRIDMAVLITNKNLLVNTKSTALAYEGIIIGAERLRDQNEYKWKTALEEYERDPQNALDTNIVKVEGDKVIALDTRDEVGGQPNKKKGQPIKDHLYMRELHVVARKAGETDFTKGSITLWNDQAKLVIPTMKLVSFLANGEIKDGVANLRSSVDTQFSIDKELTDEEIVSVIDDKYQNDFRTLAECWEYHNQIKDDKKAYWSSMVVTEGAVTWIQEFEKSMKIVITDDSLNEIPFHERGVTCWLPIEQKKSVNFAKGSIITVVGRTGEGNYYDSEKQAQTQDKILQMNAFSIIGRPGLVIESAQEGESI
jgi:hypothetical protein